MHKRFRIIPASLIVVTVATSPVVAMEACDPGIQQALIEAAALGAQAESARSQDHIDEPETIEELACLDDLWNFNLDVLIKVPQIALPSLCEVAQYAWDSLAPDFTGDFSTYVFNAPGTENIPEWVRGGTKPVKISAGADADDRDEMFKSIKDLFGSP